MAEPFAHTMRVRYVECDALGVVFNAHYLTYLDQTMTELFRAATVTHIGTTSLVTRHRIRRGGELLLAGEMVHVWVRRGSAEKTPIPEWARAGLRPWCDPANA